MDNVIKNFYTENYGQSVADYDKSHGPRFDFLIEDLKLNSIKNSKILDIGCGYGPLFHRLNVDKNNNKYIGIDGASIQNNFEYYEFDLSYDFFAKKFENQYFEYIFCFETLEHLTNPYHCLIEIKKLMNKDSILYLSIPDQSVEHNTIYPSLLYPIEHFIIFLRQCAMLILDLKLHDKAFKQHVFTLKSADWTECSMLWKKHDSRLNNLPPHISINL